MADESRGTQDYRDQCTCRPQALSKGLLRDLCKNRHLARYTFRRRDQCKGHLRGPCTRHHQGLCRLHHRVHYKDYEANPYQFTFQRYDTNWGRWNAIDFLHQPLRHICFGKNTTRQAQRRLFGERQKYALLLGNLPCEVVHFE